MFTFAGVGMFPAFSTVLFTRGLPAQENADTLRPMVVKSLTDTLERDTLIPVPLPSAGVSPVILPVHVVYLPDSLIRDSLQYEYTRIKNIAYKTKWTKELYKMVFVNPSPGRVNVMRTENSEERFRNYSGKVIKSIDIKVLPPYGTSVYDTTYTEEDIGRLKRIANTIHMRTAENVIRKQITLRPGMRLEPFELVQNEILLRELDYIDDVSISVAGVERDTNEVTLTLVCKDEFSWGVELESNFLNSAIIGLENKNFLKLGHVLNYEFSYRGTKEKKWGNILEYKVNSIWGTHINFRGYYQNNYNEKLLLASLDRQFLTSNIKWAGGLTFSRVFYSKRLPDRNITRLEEMFDYHSQDAWIGKSFSMNRKYTYNQNLYLTGRVFTTIFNNRPLVSDDTNHFYYNRVNYFAALTYTKIKYYKANLIYDFGRTEDVPTGLYTGLVAGFENNEFQKSGYFGVEGRYSHFNKNTERFYAVQGAMGSNIGTGGLERGFIKANAMHISNLCNVGSCKYRFYNTVNYIRGIRRYPADYLYMQDYDIRGFRSDTLAGSQKLSGSLSATLFLPFIKRGFRVSVSAFLDGGAIAEKGQSLIDSKTYWGIGASLNFRNDNVVIKNISFRICFYPTIPSDGRSFQAIMSSGMKSGFYDYRVSKPQVVPYE